MKPNVLKFDLIEGSSPITIGLDVLQYASMHKIQHRLSSKRSSDKPERIFLTYIAAYHTHNIRARLLLLPHYKLFTRSLLGMALNGIEAHVTKKLHRMIHAPKHKTEIRLRDAGIERKYLFNRYIVIYESCNICASSR